MFSVSKYPSAFSKVPETVSLLDELQKIKTGYYQTPILACRTAIEKKDLETYKSIKSSLPAITFSGTFIGAHRKENLQSYTNLVVVDLDNLAGHTIDEKKQLIFDDDFVRACWRSPSNNGLKFLVQVSTAPEFHRYAFDAVANHFFDKYGVEADKSGSDICRLCYVSYDPELLLKKDSSILQIELKVELPKKSVHSPKNHERKSIVEASEKKLFFQTEGRNKERERSLTVAITKYLKKTKQSITSDYLSWMKVAFAIANSFTYDLGEKYFLALCELDNEKHDEYKSKSLLEYCYRNRRENAVSLGTIVFLAKERGFMIK